MKSIEYSIIPKQKNENNKRPLSEKWGYFRSIFHLNWSHLYVVIALILSDKWKFL